MTHTFGTTMDDPINLPGGIGGLIGIAGAAVTGFALWVRNYLSKDSVSRAADVAYKALIDDQAAQLVTERARNQELRDQRDAALESREAALAVERKRTEDMRVSLDAAVAQISALRKQVGDLSDQVEKLQRQIAAADHAK